MSGNGSSSWPTARASEQENRTTRSAPSHGLTHGEVLAGVACDFMEAVLWKSPSAQEPGVAGQRLINKDGTPWTGGERAYDAETGRLAQTGLPQMVENWQSPRISIGPYTRDKGQKGAERLTLEGQSQMWASPAPMQTREGWTAEQIEAARAIEKAKGQNGNGFGLGLAAQAGIWPTSSAAHDTKGAQASAEAAIERASRVKQLALADFAHCFTPPAQRTWTSGVSPSIWRPISRRLFRSAMSSVSPTVQRRWLRKGAWRKRRLNPSFVEWLMSWPPGHAVCTCSETGFIHWQQHMRGALSALPTASGPWIWEPPSVAAAPEQMSLWG